MLATSGGHVNMVRQLLALDFASLIQESELPGQPTTFSEQLEQRIKEAMALAHDVKSSFDALETGDISTMKVILESGLDVNIRGGDFSSAWYAAAIDGKADAMALLLSRPGIEPDMRDWIGRSPLWYAASEGHVRVVQQLLDTGLVDLKAKTANGRNLLWWPCHNGFVDVVRLLLGKGVSAYEEDVDGLSPFMMAKKEKRLTVLEVLRMGVADGMEGAKN
jgi:ankyrin repeat protein